MGRYVGAMACVPVDTGPSGNDASQSAGGATYPAGASQSQDPAAVSAAADVPDAGTEAPLGTPVAPAPTPSPDAGTEAPLGGGIDAVGVGCGETGGGAAEAVACCLAHSICSAVLSPIAPTAESPQLCTRNSPNLFAYRPSPCNSTSSQALHFHMIARTRGRATIGL